MSEREALEAREATLIALVAQRYENARRAGKEGKGTHRNAGDAGHVAALWVEATRDLANIRALIAQEDRTDG